MEIIFKAYATETAAVKYFNKHFTNRTDVVIEKVSNLWLVIAK